MQKSKGRNFWNESKSADEKNQEREQGFFWNLNQEGQPVNKNSVMNVKTNQK